jgi:hypothetical protein
MMRRSFRFCRYPIEWNYFSSHLEGPWVCRPNAWPPSGNLEDEAAASMLNEILARYSPGLVHQSKIIPYGSAQVGRWLIRLDLAFS